MKKNILPLYLLDNQVPGHISVFKQIQINKQQNSLPGFLDYQPFFIQNIHMLAGGPF